MTADSLFPTRRAERYVVPLREGGSLPAVVEVEDGDLFVVKFRGSGQGAKALLAEFIVAGLAQLLELPMPEVAVVELDECFGRLEPDPEIQDILKGSRGINVGLRYLAGAYNFDPVADLDAVTVELASKIVGLDALTWNIDRTARNPNLMVWHGRTWLIDHGAAIYVHHDWSSVTPERTCMAFPQLADHVLLPRAADLRRGAASIGEALTAERLQQVVSSLPEELLLDTPRGVRPDFASENEARQAYLDLLTTRVAALNTVLGL